MRHDLHVGACLVHIVVDGRAGRALQEGVLLRGQARRLQRQAAEDQDAKKRAPNSH